VDDAVKDDLLNLRMAWRIARTIRRRNPLGLDWLAAKIWQTGTLGNERRIRAVVDYDEELFLHVDTASLIEWEIFFRGYWEPSVVSVIRKICRPGDFVVDVGANVGVHTLLMSRRVGVAGNVVAVEPHPAIRERLRRNISLNCLSNIEVLSCALSGTEGTSTLYAPSPERPNQGISSLGADPSLAIQFEVETRTLDSLLSKIDAGRLKFLKIDTEGHEWPILQGAARSIRDGRPHILFEFDHRAWSRLGATFADATGFLRDIGYGIYELHWHGCLTEVSDDKVASHSDILAIPIRELGRGSPRPGQSPASGR
jgi:FkbM family methyltransferase